MGMESSLSSVGGDLFKAVVVVVVVVSDLEFSLLVSPSP
jgi:hypothetical protein